MFRSAPGPVPDVAGLTSESGDFVLSAPQPGRYEIELAADDLPPTVVTVDAPESGEVRLEIRLGAGAD